MACVAESLLVGMVLGFEKFAKCPRTMGDGRR